MHDEAITELMPRSMTDASRARIRQVASSLMLSRPAQNRAYVSGAFVSFAHSAPVWLPLLYL